VEAVRSIGVRKPREDDGSRKTMPPTQAAVTGRRRVLARGKTRGPIARGRRGGAGRIDARER
jgi:hypothetical protein